ncbi:Cupin domain protein [compost metagenome]
MYGNQGLYMSIAECVASDDGPPPHAHSDTQETFIVLDGTFDIMTGLRNEVKVPAQSLDMISMPKTVMRAFKNTTGQVARLLVIIQGPNKMQDNVSFAEEIGEEFVERFGPEIIDKYKTIKMTFDARERLQALA